MGFTLDDIVIDRVQYGFAEDLNGNPLYTLTQLQDATINISAESTDATDNQGNLIKRFWKAKTGEFTANNAMINLNVIGAASGEGKKIASQENKIVMPKIITVKKGEKATLKDVVEGSVKVNAFSANGSMGTAYEKGTSAGVDKYALTEGGEFTPPTTEGVDTYIVKYDRSVGAGVSITNRADKFPQTVKLTLKALAVDPCHSDALKGLYIELPSFQVSPELSITLSTEGTLDYKGDMQISYCSADKELYSVVMCGDDEE